MKTRNDTLNADMDLAVAIQAERINLKRVHPTMSVQYYIRECKKRGIAMKQRRATQCFRKLEEAGFGEFTPNRGEEKASFFFSFGGRCRIKA